MGFRKSSKSSFSPDVSVISTHTISREKILKNVLVLDTLFLLIDISYNGLGTIQSSLHADDGVGTTTTSVIYGVFALSSLFFTPLIIRICGLKWTIVISMFPALLWIAANGVGVWATMIPASILVGLFGAPVWIAHGSYTMEMAKEYAKQTNQMVDKVATLFYGLFGTFRMTGYVFGDIISSTVLSKGRSENFSEPDDETIEQYCGMNDCPWLEMNITTFEDPPKTVVWSLLAVYATFNVIAIIIGCIFLDPLPQYLQPEKQPIKQDISGLLVSVIKLIKTRRIWFLIMMNIYSSSISVFLYADFSRSWVTCALGIWMVGMVFMVCHILSAIMCVTSGFLAGYTQRFPFIIFSLVIILATMLYIVFWPINKYDEWVYFIMISGISLHKSIFDPIMIALHVIAYPNNAQGSLGCYNFFWCVNATIMYGYSYYICSDIKVYIQFGMISVGYLGYFLIDWDVSKRNNTERNNKNDSDQFDMSDMATENSNNSQEPSKYTKY